MKFSHKNIIMLPHFYCVDCFLFLSLIDGLMGILKMLLGKKLNFSDLIAKSCAGSGSRLNKSGLNIENII